MPAQAIGTLPYAMPLPQARLHPLTLFFAAWNAMRGFIIPVLVVLVLRRDVRSLGWIPMAATIGAAAVGWAMLKYFTFSYWITEAGTGARELIIRSGVLAKTERHIPLSRVQDVRLTQGPLHRALRVVEVQIETAGGQGAEAKLSVLSQAEAERLREAIFAHRVAPAIVAEPGSGAVAPGAVQPVAAAPQRQTIRRVSTRELVLAGLTSNQVASGLAVVVALVAFVDDVLKLETLGPQFVKVGQAFKHWVSSGGPGALAVVAVGGFVLLVLLGLLISVFGSVLLFYGFELSLAGEDLHRSFGLFTRHASSLPRRRIQLLRIEEGLLRRMLRLATLRANSAGSTPTAGEDDKGMDVLLPVVPREEVASVLPVVFPDVAEHAHPDWRRVSRRAVWRGSLKGSAIVALFAASAVLLKGLPGLLLLLLVPAVYALNLIAYQHLGYAKDAGFFRTRRGWLSRSTHVVPIRNVQTVVIRQNPLDRRHGVATVHVDTAGAGAGGPKIANVPWQEANALGAELAQQAAAQRYRW
jgi:putative membrane protein